MRISAEAKEATRSRILQEGCRCFLEKGYRETTTRHIARACGLATGTLFNYFPNKEALAMAILDGALEQAAEQFAKRVGDFETVEEELFALIASELRALAPYRSFVGAVLETAFSPFGQGIIADTGRAAHERHMEHVGAILSRHGVSDHASFVVLHLYWTLYLGVLAHFSSDTSRHQERTWSILDQTTRIFVATLSSSRDAAATPPSSKE